MASHESNEYLLSDEDRAITQREYKELGRTRYDTRIRRTGFPALLVICLLASGVQNILQYIHIRTLKSASDICQSPYTGLGYDTPVTYSSYDDWSSENETRSNELWDGLNTNGVCVALADSYAQEHGLDLAERFPWDLDRGLYFVKAIHGVHCLKLMRNLTRSLIKGQDSAVTWHHYQHCLNSLRQDIMCRADDTPMPAAVGRRIGEGQQLKCRNWDQLLAWTQAPEQNACYRQVDDFRTASPEVGIERHAFCPEDSPYLNVAEAYFEKFGHRDLYTGRLIG